MKITKNLFLIKLSATFIAFVIWSLDTYLRPIYSYTVFYSLASMFDAEIALHFGWLIVAVLAIYLLSSITACILLKVENESCNIVVVCSVVTACVLDVITISCSFADSFGYWKIINLLWSIAVLVPVLLEIMQYRGQGGYGDGSPVS